MKSKKALGAGALAVLLAACGTAHSLRTAAKSSSGSETALLRAHVKHVFIIYQENESFDHYFGTYPGADNLATAQARAHGLRQYDPIGHRWVTPFHITDGAISSPEHSRPALLAKMDGGRMDDFVAFQEMHTLNSGDTPQDAERLGLLTISYYDCDTIPFLWKYAHTFALYDHIFQGMTGPSTPGNIELIAAQTGETQWARDPSQAEPLGDKGPGDPVVNDEPPAFGPYPHLKAPKKTQFDQRYATVMLTMTQRNDARAIVDTRGVRKDLHRVAAADRTPVPWGWYQEGYNGPNAAPSKGYVLHHNAPEYFGYLRQNPVFWNNEHNLKQLLVALRAGTLPSSGVFYIKGSNGNEFGWKDPKPALHDEFPGDNDHPGIGDSERDLAESFVATFVNAIARSKYWHDSAIIITWDDSGGFYDHVPPPQFEKCFDLRPCGDGPRLPFILISPYAKSGVVVHDSGDTASVAKFLEVLFGLPALSSMPDEAPYMPRGPRDGSPHITDLLGGFDMARLEGARPPIPAVAAEISDSIVDRFPPSMNCASLHIAPVAIPGIGGTPPPGYGPRRILSMP
jgi:phospholipase C